MFSFIGQSNGQRLFILIQRLRAPTFAPSCPGSLKPGRSPFTRQVTFKFCQCTKHHFTHILLTYSSAMPLLDELLQVPDGGRTFCSGRATGAANRAKPNGDNEGYGRLQRSDFWPFLGYQFSPRLADAGASVFWRVDKDADEPLSAHAILSYLSY